MAAENKITVIENHPRTAGDAAGVGVGIKGHPSINYIHLADHGPKISPEVSFDTYAASDSVFVNPVRSQLAKHSRREFAKNALEASGIETKPSKPGDMDITLKNVDDLEKALEALGFDEASTNKIMKISLKEQVAALKQPTIDRKGQSSLTRLLREKPGVSAQVKS